MASDAVVEGVSGAIGGCVATVATYPLMTIATLQATKVSDKAQDTFAQDSGTLARDTADIEEKAGPMSCQEEKMHAQDIKGMRRGKGTTYEFLQEVIHDGGWGSLFNGLGATLVGTTVSQGVYFYLYSTLRSMMIRRRGVKQGGGDQRLVDVTVAESLLIASLAGMGNVLLTNPIWMVATRMQVYRKKKIQEEKSCEIREKAPGPIAVAKSVYTEYGLAGFWNGVGASLIMVINPTIQYAFYEWLLGMRSKIRKRQSGSSPARPSALEVFVLSALSKAGATVLTYPMLTVKTRMMSAKRGDTELQYSSILDAIVQIGKKEGFPGYYKGIKTKITQSILAASLLLVAKEKITDMTRDILLSSRLS